MTDKKGATESSFAKDLAQAIKSFKPCYPEIIALAVKEIKYRENQPDNTNKTSKKGHHVINKGVNDLYKDIIKKFFGKIWTEITYEELRNRNIIGEDGLPDCRLLRSYDICKEIKFEIDKMRVEKPDDEGYDGENARDFGCAKIALLACVHCAMLDVHISIPSKRKSYFYYCKLKHLKKLITSHLIGKNDHGVYVDSKVKEQWDKENPDEVQVFKKCKSSVDYFLKGMADHPHLVTSLGMWVNDIINLVKNDKSKLV